MSVGCGVVRDACSGWQERSWGITSEVRDRGLQADQVEVDQRVRLTSLLLLLMTHHGLRLTSLLLLSVTGVPTVHTHVVKLVDHVAHHTCALLLLIGVDPTGDRKGLLVPIPRVGRGKVTPCSRSSPSPRPCHPGGEQLPTLVHGNLLHPALLLLLRVLPSAL